MSPTTYDYNVTLWEQQDYYFESNKTGLRGYPGGRQPITLSDYLSFDSYFNDIIYNSSAVLIWSYICLVTLGFIGNIVNIVVFTRPSMVGSMNFFLTCLELANLFFYITFVPRIAAKVLYTSNRSNYDWRLLYCITERMGDAVIFMSNWINVTIGLFRFIAVTWPLSARIWCSTTRAKLSALVIGLASVPVASILYCLNVPTPVNVVVYENVDGEAPLFFTTFYSLDSIIPFEKAWYKFRLEGFLLLVSTSIPCLISALFTFLLIGNLCVAKKRRRRLTENGVSNSTIEVEPTNENPEASRGNTSKMNATDVETRVTITLLVVLVISNLSYLPTSIYNVLILTGNRSSYRSNVANVSKSQIGIILSNSLTFFVYVTMSQRFRETLVDLVSWAFKKSAMSQENRSKSTETKTSNL